MTANPAPDLWIDWCLVAGVDPESRDEDLLARFAAQARPSRRLLNSLRGRNESSPATSWPVDLP